ncbi:MAG: cell division protein FtsW, partial [Fibrobacteres bacterium]|nr:cell division protein FtsW [Fibrobacterota bacterium]
QVFRIGFAFIFFYLALNVDYHWLVDRNRLFMIIAVGLLMYLIVNNGVSSIKGAKRWVSILGVTIQPSDMAKMVLIMYMGKMISKSEKHLQDGNTETLLSMLVIPGVIIGMIILQPNFSTAVIVSAIMGVMLFVGGLRLRFVMMAFGAAILGGIILVIKAPYRLARLKAFMSPDQFMTSSYQANQSLIGLGSGGINGVGLGQSSQKLLYLPEPFNDFIFSILGEEFGFIGIIIVFALFATLVYRGFVIASKAPDRLGFHIAIGITTMFAFYFFIHSGVVSVLFPTTGIPLPFISYGGSNLLFNMIAMGILLNISTQSGRRIVP